jgi:CheY-like chemotaxis protein
MTVLQDLRVLVVENDEMSAALLQMQLVHAGATVVGLAASVAEALRVLEDSVPDVALLDYRLARNETSEPVAAALSARGVPFVLATGMLAEQLPESMLAGTAGQAVSVGGPDPGAEPCGGPFQRNGVERRFSRPPRTGNGCPRGRRGCGTARPGCPDRG